MMVWIMKLSILFIFSSFFLCSCLAPIQVPLETISYSSSLSEKESPKKLFVFLHGRGGNALQFEEADFINLVEEKNISADMIAVEAHLGYYIQEQLLPRLKQDVIEPAKRKGYEEIWLVGVSMGGLGALLYAQAYPSDIAGLLTLAPYLGEPELSQEILDVGGLGEWSAPVEGDYAVQLWKWLQKYVKQAQLSPKIYLGYGNADYFTYSNDLLAAHLPKNRVFVESGGHHWSVWKKIWEKFLSVEMP